MSRSCGKYTNINTQNNKSLSKISSSTVMSLSDLDYVHDNSVKIEIVNIIKELKEDMNK